MTIKTGDEVRVFSSREDRPAPDGGWPATVVTMGRKYATATFHLEGYGERVIQFDATTGAERDSGAPRGIYVRSAGQ